MVFGGGREMFGMIRKVPLTQRYRKITIIVCASTLLESGLRSRWFKVPFCFALKVVLLPVLLICSSMYSKWDVT